MGLGVCAIAGFMDDAVEEFLGVDGLSETALLLTTVGFVMNVVRAFSGPPSGPVACPPPCLQRLSPFLPISLR